MVQASPRDGYRHFAVPAAGPADSLSLALANRLVGNALGAPALEITYGGFDARATVPCAIAVTGAAQVVSVSGANSRAHETLHLRAGDTITLSMPRAGARSYLAVAGGVDADTVMGSASTYLPAGFGGKKGRALEVGDEIGFAAPAGQPPVLRTPETCRPVLTGRYAVRACPSAETGALSEASQKALFSGVFTAGRQASRMGLSLEGNRMDVQTDGMMKSAPVFPGTVQCPGSGTPIVLLCDAHTTGGYPRIAQIARCDRHLLGQVRPGERIRLLHRTPENAAGDHARKTALLANWLGETFALR